MEDRSRGYQSSAQPRPPFQNKDRKDKPKSEGKGHDAVLRALQQGQHDVHVVLRSSGETLTGKIVGRDKFTITLKIDGIRVVIYKHAIERFAGEEPVAGAK
jgi:RNA chaperone Hfq